MTEFGLTTKTGKDIIMRKMCSNIQDAYEYFSKIKQMPLNEFKKIFLVVKL
tara:strand:+ start:95 stop:247 length:153 start_codon:yes stop_codon:yes gene_type:complete